MIYLWLGTMIGLVASFLLQKPLEARGAGQGRADAHDSARDRAPPSSRRDPILTPLTICIGVAVSFSIVSDFFDRTSQNGFTAAIKTVLVPWITGVGLGIWLHLIFFRPRALSTKASYAARQNIALLVIGATFLGVTLVITEERYDWLRRLQKLSLGGGSLIELSPLGQVPSKGSADPARTASTLDVDTRAYTRISEFIGVLGQVAASIDRDKKFAKAAGLSNIDTLVKDEEDFARIVTSPMGTYLAILHEQQNYNSIAYLVPDGSLVSTLRQLALNWDGTNPDERLTIVADQIESIWRTACKRLRDRDDRDKCSSALAKASTEMLPPFRYGLLKAMTRNFPYGTIISSYFLNAAGEYRAAIQDLRAWADDALGSLGRQSAQLLGAYRARYYAARLALFQEPRSISLHDLLDRHDEVVALGPQIYLNTRVQDRNWRDSYEMAFFPERVLGPLARLWHTDNCASTLGWEFKRFMIAHLDMVNNYVYLLSQNLQFTMLSGKLETMDRLSTLLSRTNYECFEHRAVVPIKMSDLNKSAATHLHTVSSAELAQASESTSEAVKKARLCQALRYVNRAIDLHKIARPGERTNQADEARDAEAAWINGSIIYEGTRSTISSQIKLAAVDCS